MQICAQTHYKSMFLLGSFGVLEENVAVRFGHSKYPVLPSNYRSVYNQVVLVLAGLQQTAKNSILYSHKSSTIIDLLLRSFVYS